VVELTATFHDLEDKVLLMKIGEVVGIMHLEEA